MTYAKKAQVLLTEEEYKTLEQIAARTQKKMSALIREAVEKVYIVESKKDRISASVDRLLSLPPVPAPKDYHEWEKEYSVIKGAGKPGKTGQN